MKFDMNLAWREASGMVSVNAQVLAIIAGVFFFLPSFAMALFAPMPEPTTGMDETQAMKMVSAYYSEAAPWLILVGITQAIGVLALLALLTDRHRPTVGEALKSGAVSFLPYFAAQLLIGVACGILALLIVGLSVTIGLNERVAFIFLFAIAFYLLTRTSVTAAVIMVESERNPIRALGRSWSLTKGNSLRLFFFYFLILLAFLVVSIVFGMIVGILAGLVISDVAMLQLVNGIISGIVSSAVAVYCGAIIASAHRQLSGPSPEAISQTFE